MHGGVAASSRHHPHATGEDAWGSGSILTPPSAQMGEWHKVQAAKTALLTDPPAPATPLNSGRFRPPATGGRPKREPPVCPPRPPICRATAAGGDNGSTGGGGCVQRGLFRQPTRTRKGTRDLDSESGRRSGHPRPPRRPPGRILVAVGRCRPRQGTPRPPHAAGGFRVVSAECVRRPRPLAAGDGAARALCGGSRRQSAAAGGRCLTSGGRRGADEGEERLQRLLLPRQLRRRRRRRK